MRLAPKVALTLALISVISGPSMRSASWAAGTIAVQTHDNQAFIPSLPGLHPNASAEEALELENSVNVRIARITNQINLEKFGGRLTNEEADNFLSALSQVAERRAEFVALNSQLAPATKTLLQLQLDRIQQIIETSLHDRKVATLDLRGREVLMQHIIAAAQKQGRLSKKDGTDLQNELATLILHQEQAAAVSGKFGYGQALVYSLKIDKITDELARRLHPRTFTAPDVRALAAEVEQLRQKESQTGTGTGTGTGLENAKLISLALNHPLPNMMSPEQAAALDPIGALEYAANLEWLKALYEHDLAGTAVGFDPTQQEKTLDVTIGGALDKGLINPLEAQQLRSDLESIVTQHQNSGGIALSPEQKTRMALALARLAGRIDRTEHAPTIFWAGIDATQAALDGRISEGLRSARLTDAQAKELRTTADNIAQTEDGLRKSPDGLTGKSALNIALQLAQLNVKLHHSLKDRIVKAPDLDQLQARLSNTIIDSVEGGKLDYRSVLSDKLNHITELKEAYSKAPGGLDDRAKLAIGDEIEHAIAEVKAAARHDQTEPPETLDMRLTQLSQDIDAAAFSGALATDRSAQYHAAVDTVCSDLVTARKDGSTAQKSLAIANDISSLRDQFDDEVRDTATLPLHLVPRIRDLAGRVGRALADGRLSLHEASELIAQLDHAGERLASAASTQGGLSHGEGLQMDYVLQSMSERLESALADRPFAPAQPLKLSIRVDTKLANRLSSGKLSVEQAEKLHSAFNTIVDDSNAFEKSDNKLSYPEALALNLEWNQLDKMVDNTAPATKGLADINTRRAELEKRINDAVASGKLSHKDALTLATDLDHIAQSEADFRVTDEKLDFNEAMTLSLELERLSSKVDGLVHGQLSLQQKH
jgi:hypothetical protein